MIHSGLVSVTFRSLEPLDILKAVCRAGLNGIEWGGDVHVPHGDIKKAREVRRITEEAGLAVVAYGSYYCFGDILGTQGALSFDPVLETAAALGAPVIRVWAGRQGSLETPAIERETIVRAARRIGGAAAKESICVAFEYHSETLTDTSESALALLEEIAHPNIRSLWQPPNGRDFSYRLAGLKSIMSFLENLHVFHWGQSIEDRQPLTKGIHDWEHYLSQAQQPGKDRHALLEFVPGDSLESFYREASTLKLLLGSQ